MGHGGKTYPYFSESKKRGVIHDEPIGEEIPECRECGQRGKARDTVF